MQHKYSILVQRTINLEVILILLYVQNEVDNMFKSVVKSRGIN